MLTHRLARPLLAGIFVVGGIDAVIHPERKLLAAETVTTPLTRMLRQPCDTKTLVRANGATQIAAGLLLAGGVLPRSTAASLAASLVPTTLAGHAFWNQSDPVARSSQRTQFLKNAAILGGLLLASTDTDGNPSLSWRARHTLTDWADDVAASPRLSWPFATFGGLRRKRSG